jgi:O-antigen/teichoic acid export membrane protein
MLHILVATVLKPQEGLGQRAVATLAMSVGGTALGVVGGLVLARALGTHGYGAYSWALAVAGGLSVPAALGFDLLLVREAAVLGRRGDWPALRGMWVRARSMSAVAGVVLAAAVAALAAGLHGVLPDGLLVPLLLALPTVPLLAQGLLQQAVAQGLHRPAAGLAAWSLLRQLVLLACVGTAILAGDLAPAGAVLLSAVAALAAYVACARTLRRIVPAGPATQPTHGWARNARPMAITSSVTVVDAQLGLVALGLLDGPRAVGLFAAATQATVGFVLVRNAAGRPLAPLIASLHDAGGGSPRLQAELTRATRWVASVTLLGAIAVAVLARPLLSLFGPGFADAAPALRLLAVAHVVNGWVAFNGTVLTVTGHAADAARAATLAISVNAVLLAVLVPTAGVEGAAVAALVGVTVRNQLNSRMVRRKLGLRTSALGSLGA